MMTLRPLSVASAVFWGTFTLVAFGADADTVYVGDWQGRVHCFDVKQKQLRQAR